MKLDFLVKFLVIVSTAFKEAISQSNSCSEPFRTSSGWQVNCQTYRIERIANRQVKVTCRDFSSPYTTTMFGNLNVSDVTCFLFIECPPPETSFGEILREFRVIELTYQVLNRNVTIHDNIFQGLTSVERISLICPMMTNIPELIFTNLMSPRFLTLTLTTNVSHLPEMLFGTSVTLTELNLIGNQFSTLLPPIFNQLFNLNSLTITNGQLTSLASNIFSSLYQLQFLSLRNNRIRIISPENLSNLKNLLIFDASSNDIQSVDSNLFRENLNLTSIDMSFNPVGTRQPIPYNLLENLNQLKDLNIRDCNLNSIPDGFFAFAPALKKLNMYNNRVNAISTSMFSGNENLEELNMQFNDVVNIEPDAFERLPKLRLLNLGMNNMRSLPQGLLDSNANLETIVFEGTFISDVSGNLFDKLVNLKRLNLRNNLLARLNGLTPFGPGNNLEYVDVSYNNFEANPVINWTVYTNLVEVNMRYNLIVNYSLPVMPFENANVYVRNNRIERVSVTEIETANSLEVMTADVKIATVNLELINNPFLCDCSLLKFAEYVNSTIYSARYRRYNVYFLQAENYTCRNPRSLRNRRLIYLDKRDFVCNVSASCPDSCHCYFRAVDGATIANCSHRGLKELPSVLPPNTTELYLKGNQLQSIDGVSAFEDLRVLDVSNNRLLCFEWIFPPNITELYLNNNNMTAIPNSVLEVVRKPNSKVFLSGNPFSCECSFKELRSAMSIKNADMTDFQKISCVTSSGIQRMLADVSDLRCPGGL